jgi:hypothetical protein
MRFLISITALLFCVGFSVEAQEEEPKDQRFTVDTPVNLDFRKEEEPVDTKKKKVKKKVFYGIKTKKGFTRRGTGERVSFEIFYYLKNLSHLKLLFVTSGTSIMIGERFAEQARLIQKKECYFTVRTEERPMVLSWSRVFFTKAPSMVDG